MRILWVWGSFKSGRVIVDSGGSRHLYLIVAPISDIAAVCSIVVFTHHVVLMFQGPEGPKGEEGSRGIPGRPVSNSSLLILSPPSLLSSAALFTFPCWTWTSLWFDQASRLSPLYLMWSLPQLLIIDLQQPIVSLGCLYFLPLPALQQPLPPTALNGYGTSFTFLPTSSSHWHPPKYIISLVAWTTFNFILTVTQESSVIRAKSGLCSRVQPLAMLSSSFEYIIYSSYHPRTSL